MERRPLRDSARFFFPNPPLKRSVRFTPSWLKPMIYQFFNRPAAGLSSSRAQAHSPQFHAPSLITEECHYFGNYWLELIGAQLVWEKNHRSHFGAQQLFQSCGLVPSAT